MNLQGFYTAKGFALAAKVSAGTKLTITKVTAGSGTTATSALALAEEKQTLTVGTAEISGQTATLPVTLAEASAPLPYVLTEIGVYASDPEEGEILYQVFRLDTSRGITAGGESVYRFYLRESMGAGGVTVTCSPAGLLVDEDIAPVRSKVLATSVPSRAVMLTAAELQGYLNALPKMLTENITLNVTGTLDSALSLSGFYGSGSLIIDGGHAFTLSNSNTALYVANCCIGVSFYNMTILSTTVGGGFGAVDTCYLASNSRIDFVRCTIQGGGYNIGVRPRGVCVTSLQNCTLTGNYIALDIEEGSVATVIDATCSENAIGGRVYHGGILLLAGTTPELLGGTSNGKHGGIIAKADGTLI